MMIDSSRAISTESLLDNTVWAGSRSGADMLGEVEASNDLSTATGTGRLADLMALIVDGSGMGQRYIVEHKQTNERSIALLRRWIDEYGDDRDPDLDEQIKELNTNRLSLHERC
jgi:hypothetical protein